MKKPKAVYIEWVDSATTDPGWMSEKEALDWGKSDINNTIFQIGFEIKKTKKTLLIASGISDGNIVVGVFKIPMPCIIKLIYLLI